MDFSIFSTKVCEKNVLSTCLESKSKVAFINLIRFNSKNIFFFRQKEQVPGREALEL